MFQSTVVRERASHVPEVHLSCGGNAGSRRIPMGELGREIVGGGNHTDTPEVPLVTPQWGQRRKSFFFLPKSIKNT